MKPNKIKQAEQRTVKRSEINFASYNPRTISDEARKKLKKNLQTVGLLGGVVWNMRSGNLVSGHQKVSIMDAVNRYDAETGANDYEFRVEVVDFDDKTEKEQNLFMNNRAVQGTYDDDMLRELLQGIDYTNAGFDDTDMQLLGLGDFGDYDMGDMFGDDGEDATDGGDADAPGEPTESKDWSKGDVVGEREDLAIHDEMTKESGENHKLDRSADFYQDSEANQIARHNEVQKIKDRIASQNDVNKDGGMLSYVVISFKTPSEKVRFMEDYGFDPMAKYINGEEFVNKLEFGDDED
ncbi:hypothetical protein NF347_08735 [Paramuribaculum intestinale]|uniref:hypothetical protein n=1 Tax=Paramuribaculum intestinale TaxID=2094151 RepID=UPI000D1EDD0B|nr:hypothetical protein [Paramuribaculum intestinale]PWB09620.1 hypothetical protein C5O24_06980 [Paramuribaculum intestinale]ROS85160.1 hypothetical protein EEK90_03175 [Muribaculaceae bacterium Isolate-036 (Harlan)]ROS92365.1 hypothetical protein EEL36_09065 [Muribaculaceae bacterium Isolate-043 (Harlan)]WLT41072.1 hypothetical protein NF347_08735 [Paramuribaculum intestinale]